MARYLSEDLRLRVIEAVRAGASRRQAAARFGVSVSSAIRWVAEWRANGRTAPRVQDGDRRSDRIEAEDWRQHQDGAAARTGTPGRAMPGGDPARPLEDHHAGRDASRGHDGAHVIDGAMNGEAFRAWVRHMLAPSLRSGEVVVMDNLPAHKVGGIREAIEAAGARLFYLPPYSPDFNPIEQAFAKLKALLRKAAARTLEGLETAIAAALDAFLPAECANYFNAAGYEPD